MSVHCDRVSRQLQPESWPIAGPCDSAPTSRRLIRRAAGPMDWPRTGTRHSRLWSTCGRRHHSSPYPLRAGTGEVLVPAATSRMPGPHLLTAGPAPTYPAPGGAGAPTVWESGGQLSVRVDNGRYSLTARVCLHIRRHGCPLQPPPSAYKPALRDSHRETATTRSMPERPHTLLDGRRRRCLPLPGRERTPRWYAHPARRVKLGDLVVQLASLGRRQLRNQLATASPAPSARRAQRRGKSSWPSHIAKV